MECPQTPAAAVLSESVTRVNGGATWERTFLVKAALSLPAPDPTTSEPLQGTQVLSQEPEEHAGLRRQPLLTDSWRN